jgi:pilus assembly protein Flp/PilA
MRGERTQREGAQPCERGATAIEYGLLVALIAVVMIAAVSLMSSRISAVFLAAAEPFSDAQPAELAVDAKVKPGKSVTMSLAQLSGLKNVKQLKVKANVVGGSGKAEGNDNGSVTFEAAERATGTATIAYAYSYKQGTQTMKGEGSLRVAIVA